MNGWTGMSVGTVLLVAGCILPLDITVDGDGDGSHGIRGSGRVVTENRVVAGFHGVLVSGVGRVVVERTGREALRITAEDNIVPHLRSEVRDGTLILGPKPGVSLSPREEMIYHLEVVELDRIESSGAVSFEADLGRQPELDVVLSGVCVVEATGSVDRLSLTLSGVTGFGGIGLESARAHIEASGVSWANVWVTDRLDAWASGVSSVRYKGSPAVYAHTSGSSSVNPY